MLFNLLAADDFFAPLRMKSRGIPAATAYYCAAAARLSLQRQHGLGPFAEVRSYDKTGGGPEHELYGLATEARAASSVLAAASSHDACTLGAAQMEPCLHKTMDSRIRGNDDVGGENISPLVCDCSQSDFEPTGSGLVAVVLRRRAGLHGGCQRRHLVEGFFQALIPVALYFP